MRKLVYLTLLSLNFFSCSSLKVTNTVNPNPKLKFVNAIEVPFNQEFKNTVVGGLSSIDYDSKNDLYYFICDDRAVYNDARFYTAKIQLDADTIKKITFQDVVSLKNAAGAKYSNWEKYPDSSIDPEEMRYNPKTKSVVWSSEGARVIAKDFTVIQNPSLQTAFLNGSYINDFSLPKNLNMQKEEKGPRSNGVLEGITFNSDFSKLYTNVEEPLYEDDQEATTTKGGMIRLFEFDTKTRKNTAQYGYLLDPIAHEPNPHTGFAVNGISTIQYYDKNQLLIVERSYSVGKQACTIKVYLCDLTNATNVKDIASLQNEGVQLASKKLVLNMDDLGIFTDNIEGITFGPKLANGKQSILFVSDNNFSDKQKTQVLLFEVE
ncbi:esterase-like activity of phytase family protein [Flavobacterium muglaense]|uniref:Esterase-like activity of phytase family protein n=1 Tax=Flavobacterium muglaense TaxID=2764716 RepID=A0A923MWG3_9FLAO|nr:esterase-like activity of phytase family protein [Flavobacterium muglaense]MBC5836419.1 esterase-like activity of phytase family protein [Flavobacterium muglaense]MBC5842949.1 esterase-like activity of phytase family protein [Flavobacterium muglaense]